MEVTVLVPNSSRLVLDFSNHQQVLTDACVLLGHIGALQLLELGYTGPLAKRPRVAACERAPLAAAISEHRAAEGELSEVLPDGALRTYWVKAVPFFDAGRYLGAATYMTVLAERPSV